MTGIRLLQTCAIGATMLLAGSSFGQPQPMPPPPPPPPPPEQQPPPPPPPATEVAPMSPVAAATGPKSADDMTGSIGFGIGIGSSSQLLSSTFADTTTKQVALRYWTSDTMVFQPALNFNLNKTDGDMGVAWNLAPEALVLFVPVRGNSTRLLAGGGLGMNFVHPSGGDTTFMFYLPVQAGVEHFFARWFSVGLAARTNFFQMATGDPYNIQMALSSTSLFGSAFIYTD